MSDLTDTYLGQFHLIEVIRRGGMSTVYKAYQASLDRYVAIKVLLQINDPQFGARFAREARAIAQLQHHNILPIYDYGEQGGLSYLVLQYIENGVTLADMLGAPLPPTQALRLTNQVLAALDYAHSRGIVHRDIKPANILMPSPNWVMLADFGIAKLIDDGKNLTSPGLIVGTAAYMAPEQAAGQPIDARTDLYAAGIMLYEMVTGQVPFDADTPVAMLTKHAYEPPPPPRSRNPDLPEALEAALLRALAKAPDERYPSAAEMMASLEQVLEQIELPHTHGQLAGLYQAGLRAIEAGRWDTAVERLGQLVALDPGYEDAIDLLGVAYEAQDRVKIEARQQLELVRRRRQSAIYPQVQAPDGPAPVARPEPDARPTSTAPAGASVARRPPDDPRKTLQLESRQRRRLLGAILVAVAFTLLLIASRVAGLWPGQAVPAMLGVSPVPTAGVAPTASVAPSPAVSTAAPAQPAPAPVGKLVYQDDFSGGAGTSWLEDQVNATDFSRGFHPPGVYHIRLSQPNETRRVVLPRFAYQDFSLQIDLWDESDDFAGDVAQ